MHMFLQNSLACIWFSYWILEFCIFLHWFGCWWRAILGGLIWAYFSLILVSKISKFRSPLKHARSHYQLVWNCKKYCLTQYKKLTNRRFEVSLGHPKMENQSLFPAKSNFWCLLMIFGEQMVNFSWGFFPCFCWKVMRYFR